VTMKNEKKIMIIYSITFLVVIAILGLSVIKINVFNHTNHHKKFADSTLFTEDVNKKDDVSVNAVARSSTWTKVFDFNNEGLTEHNYQAYTYDFSILNQTNDEVSKFSFRLTFDHEAFISSAWNGALEIHQNVAGKEISDTVPDMRVFDASEYSFDTVTFDGETLIRMNPGDYINYIPSSSKNAMEMPIEPMKGTTPGMIMYIAIGESIEGSSLELDYTFHRLLNREPLFWTALVSMMLWLIALTIHLITASQIKKYNERHKRDNEIIRESIETFTGFIDAKDGYTNGHSMRVADYTKLIAKELGYEGEELEWIYYVALLHDCGKIGVPDNILCKPGRLTDEEFEVIKSHTVRGGEILSHFKSLKNVGDGARYHHERYDGRGYPEGRAGEDIPFIARMICVADSFDAMNSNRVYRKKLTREHILSEIETNKGKQFDPKIADVMLKLIAEGKIKIEDELI
ncbi:MAG: HD-GYP domain-containing protein, partial [Lachnospiraceae bacterium]|nr:HD-GYP domain-containing protein [Lachnospiraceae bacterium]